MGWKLTAALLVLGCWVSGALAQVPSFTLKRYDDVPDLMNAQISGIFPDTKGFLWLTTDAGLVRFDGSSFVAFRNIPGDSTSISYNNTSCITEDQNGNLWVGLWRNGISRYDRRTGRFQNYPFTRNLKPSTATVVGLFVDREGIVWAGVDQNGLVRLNPKTGETRRFDVVTRQSSPHMDEADISWANTAYQFWQDPESGLIWMVSRDGLYVMDPHTGHCEPKRSPVYDYSQNQTYNMWGLCPDGDEFWIGGWDSGLKRVNYRNNEHKIYFYNDTKKTPGLPMPNIINGLANLHDGFIWVATQDRGVGLFNKQSEQFYFFDKEAEQYPGLSKGTASPLSVDIQGNLWFCINNILSRVTPDKSLFRTAKVVEDKRGVAIRNVFEDRDGRFQLISTQYSSGFRVLDKSSGKSFFPDLAEVGDKITMGARQAPDGSIWAISRLRLYHFNPSTQRMESSIQPNEPAQGSANYLYTGLEIDHEGWFWIGTSSHGLLHFNPKTGETEAFRAQKDNPNTFPSNTAGVLALDQKGRCWLGSLDQTYYGYWLPDKKQFVRLDVNGQATESDHSQRTNGIVADAAGNIWICSEAGLLYFDCSGEKPVFVKKYTMASGLPSDYVTRIAQDLQGNIWGLALRELFCLDRKTERITTFGKSDGFSFLSPWAISASHDGLMYVYGESGTYWYFDPATIQKKTIKPGVALISILADGNELYQGSEPVPASAIDLPTDCKNFSLGFAVLDFLNPAKYELEYQLEGLDKEWVRVGTRRFFGFSGVPPGQYIFKLKYNGAPDDQAISIPLVVRVSFFRTNWFRFLMLAIILAGGWYYYQLRQRQKHRLQELERKTQLLEKEKAIVMYESLKQQLNPHFLFNSLTSLGSLILIDPRAAAVFLENLSKTYRYILRSSEYELVPLSDELKFAKSFVSLQKTRFEKGFDVAFRIPEDYYQRKIVPVMLQNMLENAIKHNIIDEESPLLVEIFVADDALVVRNNLQRKKFVESSNRKGLEYLRSFYRYLTDRPIVITETEDFFEISIPLL